MKPTQYSDVNDLLHDLQSGIRAIFGNKLLGFYLYGSLVWGDFDYPISDVDTFAVIEQDIDENILLKLQQLHEQMVEKYPKWAKRIEVQYFSKIAVETICTQVHPVAVISSGESVHIVNSSPLWCANLYVIQEQGLCLYGVNQTEVIPFISKEYFVNIIKQHVNFWKTGIENTRYSRPYQSYAMLTLCRALYTITFGEQPSKKQAAEWVKKTLPQYADRIDKALQWRLIDNELVPNPEQTYPLAKEFVQEMIERIAKL